MYASCRMEKYLNYISSWIIKNATTTTADENILIHFYSTKWKNMQRNMKTQSVIYFSDNTLTATQFMRWHAFIAFMPHAATLACNNKAPMHTYSQTSDEVQYQHKICLQQQQPAVVDTCCKLLVKKLLVFTFAAATVALELYFLDFLM